MKNKFRKYCKQNGAEIYDAVLRSTINRSKQIVSQVSLALFDRYYSTGEISISCCAMPNYFVDNMLPCFEV